MTLSFGRVISMIVNFKLKICFWN